MNARTAGFFDLEDPGTRTGSRVAVAVWAGWTAVTVALVSSHEMWRDELQAWAIARDSTWPWELIHNTAYEGHPPLWHLVLWPIARLTSEAVGVQFAGVACSSATVWLVLRYLPFTMPISALLVFGYFPLFEMGVIARSYSLLFLLVVGVLVLADRRPLPLVLTTSGLAAAALTHALAIPLVIAMAVMIAMRHRELPRWQLTIAAATLAWFVAVAAELARPPRQDGRRLASSVPETEQLQHVLAAPLRIAVPWFRERISFWGDFATAGIGVDERWLGLAALIVGTLVLRRSRAALVIWIGGTVGYLTMTAVFSLPMAPRQLTILWLTALAAVWTAGSDALGRRTVAASAGDVELPDADRPPPGDRRPTAWVLGCLGTAVLLAGVAGAVWPVATDLREPFSGAEEAATWIREHNGTNPVVFCSALAPTCSSVAIRLDAPAYSSWDGQPFSYVVWRRGWNARVPPELVVADAIRLEARLDRPVAVVAEYGYYPPGCDLGWVSPPTIEPTERLVVCMSDHLLVADGTDG